MERNYQELTEMVNGEQLSALMDGIIGKTVQIESVLDGLTMIVDEDLTMDDVLKAKEEIMKLSDEIDTAISNVNVDEVQVVQSQLMKLAEEIKQVALDTHGGTTSPIDLGEWLY